MVAPVMNEELLAVADSLATNKAPGPDGVPNSALKAAIILNPSIFRLAMQRCLDKCRFPDRWKRQKLVLLPKAGQPIGVQTNLPD